MDDDAGLISVGLDGQAGQADTFYTSSEIRAGAISADGRHVVFSSLADNLTLSDASRRHHRRWQEPITPTAYANKIQYRYYRIC